MKHHSFVPSQYLVSMVLGIPLGILGFKVAGLWGVLAGLVVGAVLTARMLMREAEVLEMPLSAEHAALAATTAEARGNVVDLARAAKAKRRFGQPAAAPVLH